MPWQTREIRWSRSGRGTVRWWCADSPLGLLVDDRTLVNAPLRLKPLKFSISVGTYAVTPAWLLTHVRRGRRAVSGADFGLTVVQMSFRGTTLHFSKATPADVAIDNVVAGGAYAAWLTTVAVGSRCSSSASALRWGPAWRWPGWASRC